MEIGGVRWGRPSAAERQRLLESAQQADVTYDHIGSTLEPERWPDRRPRARSRVLGHGDETFALAVARLNTWAPQRALGAAVFPEGIRPTLDATLLVELRLGPLTVVVPDRVVAVVDEPGRWGFAYGTLPGHAERGEESFLVTLGDDGTVTGTVTVDAVMGTLAARLATPVVYGIQRFAVARYLGAVVIDA
jgi:uncharacterized protein (UPF0548 family)